MPTSKFDWLQRVKTVEREHTVIRCSVDYLSSIARIDPIVLPPVIRVRDTDESLVQLEGTYVVRLFAEFETALRTFWIAVRATDPPSRTRDLVESIGVRNKIPHDHILNAHAVREFRNGLVHEREDEVAPVPIATARKHLCVFLSFLPLHW